MNRESQIELKRGTEIVGAVNEYNYVKPSSIPVLDGGMGPLWLVRQQAGFSGFNCRIIRELSWEAAWEANLDEHPNVPDEDLCYAYGLDSARELRKIVARAENEDDETEFPDLESGYEYQPNFGSSNGIVCTEDVTLIPLTPEVLQEFDIRLSIGRI